MHYTKSNIQKTTVYKVIDRLFKVGWISAYQIAELEGIHIPTVRGVLRNLEKVFPEGIQTHRNGNQMNYKLVLPTNETPTSLYFQISEYRHKKYKEGKGAKKEIEAPKNTALSNVSVGDVGRAVVDTLIHNKQLIDELTAQVKKQKKEIKELTDQVEILTIERDDAYELVRKLKEKMCQNGDQKKVDLNSILVHHSKD